MKTEELDKLIARLAFVRDDAVAAAVASPEADRLFRQVVAVPAPNPLRRRRRLVCPNPEM